MGTADKQQAGQTTRTTRPAFFCTSGPLAADRPGYISRQVDEQLAAAVAGSTFVHVTGSPLVGKTSLLLRMAQQLREAEEPAAVAQIDLSQLAQRESHRDAARWLYAIAFRLSRQLRVGFDLQAWWSDNSFLPHQQRMFELFREFVLAFPTRPVVLLFDDIDLAEFADATGPLLAAIRMAFDARATDPAMARLCIVYVGLGATNRPSAAAQDLPYAISTEINVRYFTLGETLRLAPALGFPRKIAELAMQRIFDWASGQPATTQYLAYQLAREDCEDDVVSAVDRTVSRNFALRRDRQAHQVLLGIEMRILAAAPSLRRAMLISLGMIAKHRRMLFDPDSEAHAMLLRLSVVQLSPDGLLDPTSRLSRQYFNAGWANRHLPARYAGLAKAAALIATAVLLPYWYQQLLPKPATAVLSDPASSIAMIEESYQRLHRWPGYDAAAQRMATIALTNRAAQTTTEADLQPILKAMRETLDNPSAAARAHDAFWDNAYLDAAVSGDRAVALHTAIQANLTPSLPDRRRVSGLIASDLPRLEHIIRQPERIDEWALRRQDETIVVRSGTRVSQWSLQQSPVILESSLTTDLPVVVPQPTVGRFTITGGAGVTPMLRLVPRHQRLSDIRLSVQSPAGAVLDIDLDELAEAADLAAVDLRALARDATLSLGRIDGEWVVSAFDVRPGETGSIAVSVGRRMADLSEPQPMVLSDPMLLPADAAVLAPGGRYAVTLPSSSARLFTVWDLRSDAWQASFDPGGDVQWLGITAQARAALYLQSARITGFRVRDGSAYPIQSITFPVAAATFSDNKRWLAAQSIENARLVTVVDVLTDNATELRLDEAIERIVISDSGDMLAVIGSDRSVTIVNVADGSQRARYLLSGDFRAGYFSQGDEHLILHTTGGALRSFATSPSEQPVASWEEGVVWTAAQDRRSSLSLIGASGRGFVLHDFNRSRDLSLPFSGLTGQKLVQPYLRLRSNIAALTEAEAGTISIWRPQLSALPVGSRLVRKAWLSSTAQAFAFVDRNEQFSVVRMDAGPDELDVLEESVSLISHSQPPELVRFSAGDRLALSIESTGLFRVRHVDDGQFFDFLGKNADGVLDAAFSPDSSQFLILGARAYSIHDSETGDLLYREVREQSLSAVVPQLGGSGWLIADVDGGLWQLPRVQPGQPVSLQSRTAKMPENSDALWYASQRWLVAGQDDRLFIRSHRSQAWFALPLGGEISEVRLTEDESVLLARAGNWLYRIALHRHGGEVTHARLLPSDALAYRGFAIRDRHGMTIALLAGVDEPALRRVSLDYADEKPVAGSPDDLAQRWSWLSAFGSSSALSRPSSND